MTTSAYPLLAMMTEGGLFIWGKTVTWGTNTGLQVGSIRFNYSKTKMFVMFKNNTGSPIPQAFHIFDPDDGAYINSF